MTTVSASECHVVYIVSYQSSLGVRATPPRTGETEISSTVNVHEDMLPVGQYLDCSACYWGMECECTHACLQLTDSQEAQQGYTQGCRRALAPCSSSVQCRMIRGRDRNGWHFAKCKQLTGCDIFSYSTPSWVPSFNRGIDYFVAVDVLPLKVIELTHSWRLIVVAECGSK